MNIFRILIILCIPIYIVNAEVNDRLIKEFSQNIKKDSVLRYLEEITGVREIYIDGKATKIHSRYRLDPGNELAAKYLEQKLSQFGYTTFKNSMNSDYNKVNRIENVSALKKGFKNSRKLIVLCAHYDSANPKPAQAADDNGSGVAAVLEISRVLNTYNTTYDVLIEFFDDEEMGRVGSIVVSDSLFKLGKKDVICINIDMMGYSKTKNYITQVKFDPNVNNSKELASLSQRIDDILQLQTKVAAVDSMALTKDYKNKVVYGSGDAQFFGVRNYGNISIAERSRDDEHNPCYHKLCDSIGNMDLDYHFENVLLGAGILIQVANHELKSSSVKSEPMFSISQCIPNPASDAIFFNINTEQTLVSMDLYNSIGLKIKKFSSINQGHNSFNISNLNLNSGLYFCRFVSKNGSTVVRIVDVVK